MSGASGSALELGPVTGHDVKMAVEAAGERVGAGVVQFTLSLLLVKPCQLPCSPSGAGRVFAFEDNDDDIRIIKFLVGSPEFGDSGGW